MKVALVLVALALLLSGSGVASRLDGLAQGTCAMVGVLNPAECAIQYDGGRHGDAADVCRPQLQRPIGVGATTNGLLVPGDDEVDYFELLVPASRVGRLINVTVDSGLRQVVPANLPTLARFVVIVQTPDCLGPAEDLIGGSRYAFIPRAPGAYHVQVTLRLSVGLDVDGAGQPGAEVCHDICWGQGINPTAGYTLRSSG